MATMNTILDEVNPFLHVTLHAVAEKQVEARDPIEPFSSITQC